MANKNSLVKRIAPELDEIIKRTMGMSLLKGNQVPYKRVTLAIARQYKKYPNLLKELQEADLR